VELYLTGIHTTHEQFSSF